MNSTQKFLVNAVLPSVAVVLAGVSLYLLTGGEEEGQECYDEPKESEQGVEGSISSQPVDWKAQVESRLGALEEKHRDAEGNRPAWASELQELLRGLAEDVRHLKHTQPMPHSEGTPTPIEPLAAPEDPLVRLCDAIYGFLCGLGDELPVSVRAVLLATENSGGEGVPAGAGANAAAAAADVRLAHSDSAPAPVSSEILQGLDVLLMFVRNLARQPLNVRYRRIASSNASFQKLLAPLPRHAGVLTALGFCKQGAHWELAENAAAARLEDAVRLLEAAKDSRDAFLRCAAALLPAEGSAKPS